MGEEFFEEHNHLMWYKPLAFRLWTTARPYSSLSHKKTAQEDTGGVLPPIRYMFVKKVVKNDTNDSIFVSGIPSGVSETDCVEFFSHYAGGPVKTFAMHPSRSSALVVFGSREAVDHLLLLESVAHVSGVDGHRVGKKHGGKKRQRGREVEALVFRRRNRNPSSSHDGTENEQFGLKGWVKEHRRSYNQMTNATLQRQLDAWMEEFEEREAREKEEAMLRMEDDGWTVVRRHKGRKKNTDDVSGITVGAVAAAAAREIAMRAKEKEEKHENFYRFQQKEKRRSDLLDLREKFEQDKKRLAQLRAARKFAGEYGE